MELAISLDRPVVDKLVPTPFFQYFNTSVPLTSSPANYTSVPKTNIEEPSKLHELIVK